MPHAPVCGQGGRGETGDTGICFVILVFMSPAATSGVDLEAGEGHRAAFSGGFEGFELVHGAVDGAVELGFVAADGVEGGFGRGVALAAHAVERRGGPGELPLGFGDGLFGAGAGIGEDLIEGR